MYLPSRYLRTSGLKVSVCKTWFKSLTDGIFLIRAILYYRSRDQNTAFIKRVQRGYLIVNVLVYIILVTFLVLIFVFSTPLIVTIIHPLEVRTYELKIVKSESIGANIRI